MHGQNRAETHSDSNHTGKERRVSSSAKLACGGTVDHARATSPSSTGFVRHRLPSTGSAALTILVLLLWYLANHFGPCAARLSRATARSIGLPPPPPDAEPTNALHEVFQVSLPVLTSTRNGTLEITDGSPNASAIVVPSDTRSCQQTLVVHSFGNSYGKPYIGTYQPPACSFNRVTWNLTVTSGPGRQFDRLGAVYLGDIEVFRTSTAEPSKELAIQWTYLKDMTAFLSLLRSQQIITFDLGNLINDVYTAPFNVTITAVYYTIDQSVVPADLIIPVFNRSSDTVHGRPFQLSKGNGMNELTLPRNIKKAVFTIAAAGQLLEEFWFANALQSEIYTFNSSFGELPGFSPFREIYLIIDGEAAGVAWPFPIIFTGGVVPGLWRPVVGIDAFDLKEDEIEITPRLPLLCDGNPHTFVLAVSGLNGSTTDTIEFSLTTDQYWLVTGKIFVWLDEPGHITTGGQRRSSTPKPDVQVSSQIIQASNGTNETLVYKVKVRRQLSISSTINLSSGPRDTYWNQSLTYSNSNNYSHEGNVSTTIQHTTGHDVSSSGYAKRYSYPLYSYSVTGDACGNLTIYSIVNRGKDVEILGQPAFPIGVEPFAAIRSTRKPHRAFQGASLSTWQNGTAYYTSNRTAKTSFTCGSTELGMLFSGLRAASEHGHSYPDQPKITQSDELFKRHVLAVNGTVVEDEETLIGKHIAHDHLWLPGWP